MLALEPFPSMRQTKADRERTGAAPGNSSKFFGIMVARDGVEPPTPAFSESPRAI
jgi:hypothetical protein